MNRTNEDGDSLARLFGKTLAIEDGLLEALE